MTSRCKIDLPLRHRNFTHWGISYHRKLRQLSFPLLMKFITGSLVKEATQINFFPQSHGVWWSYNGTGGSKQWNLSTNIISNLAFFCLCLPRRLDQLLTTWCRSKISSILWTRRKERLTQAIVLVCFEMQPTLVFWPTCDADLASSPSLAPRAQPGFFFWTEIK